MSIIPTFHLKKELSDKFEINIKEKNIKHITHVRGYLMRY